MVGAAQFEIFQFKILYDIELLWMILTITLLVPLHCIRNKIFINIQKKSFHLFDSKIKKKVDRSIAGLKHESYGAYEARRMNFKADIRFHQIYNFDVHDCTAIKSQQVQSYGGRAT